MANVPIRLQKYSIVWLIQLVLRGIISIVLMKKTVGGGSLAETPLSKVAGLLSTRMLRFWGFENRGRRVLTRRVLPPSQAAGK
eukprot:COSAG02_NODE_3356_length_6878_cov_14.421596_10_plen_83_part_00